MNNSFRMHWGDLAYRDIGRPGNLTLVFIHAMSFHQDIWTDVISHMPSRLRIVTYDQRGHGESNVPALPYSLDDYADDAIQLLDHLELRACCLVGISFGGLVAQRVAELRPDLVGRMVLSNTAMKIGVREDWMASANAARAEGFSREKVEAFFPELFSEAFCQTSLRYEELLERRVQMSVEGYIGCCQAIGNADFSENARTHPTQPALVIGSDNDVITPPDIVEDLAASLPNGQFKMIESAGHLPCVDKHMEFADLIVSFLDLPFEVHAASTGLGASSLGIR
ncbi:alpha/beta fold hydrolase [uncultured Litoreibacter sp.]|uniref:alpha/beta fold hydrolase n=1 Tax=uncultured Litoreibacter sp. TaxID=1392394 RepID=UPI002603AB1B|nr:alpha/beta fold hydrolase [uncultured Litoreibacter sp.]